MDFGSYLRILIKEKGYSYRKLALLSKVDHSYISRIVRGDKRRPTPDILRKLSKNLNATYEDLMVAAGYLDNPSKTNHNQHPSIEAFSDHPLNNEEHHETRNHLSILKRLLTDKNLLLKIVKIPLDEENLLKGDLIVIEKNTNPKIGQIAAVQHENVTELIKFKSSKGKPIKSNKILGTVIASFRMYS